MLVSNSGITTVKLQIFLKVASNVNDGEIQRNFDEVPVQPNVANRYP